MTTAALSVTGIVSDETKKDVCLDPHVIFAEYPDPYRNSWGIDGYADPAALSAKAMESIATLLEKHRGDVAAVLVEPAQGDGG